MLGPGRVHSVAGTSSFKNMSQRGLLHTWLLGPCYEDQARYTLLSGPGNVHSVIRTRIESLYTWLLGLAPIALCRMPIFATL